MKEINRNSETVLKIVESAIDLFNNNGYAGASINDISKKAGLSKGILYHYFQNKDDLYLYCSKKCIEEYIEYLEINLRNPISGDDTIAENVRLRIRFFDEFPQYRTFFNYITARKPDHLSVELTEIREKLTKSNSNRLKNNISDIELGKGVTVEDIIAFTSILQNNSSFMIQNHITESEKNERFESIVRIIKIFSNGLKKDIE